jgi:hypothetical protein
MTVADLLSMLVRGFTAGEAIQIGLLVAILCVVLKLRRGAK